jgi:glycosyltransferase involved in cell wall biosynthesis
LAQSHTHLEILVVNDHSSDAIPQILDSFALCDARVRW